TTSPAASAARPTATPGRWPTPPPTTTPPRSDPMQREPHWFDWKMPAWMEPYRGYIRDTGGNPVEELVNDNHTSVATNSIRAAMCVAVTDQVTLLYHLAED